VARARIQLLDAARALFKAEGYERVGIHAVIEAAGVSRMSLYNNFPSKEALALAAFEEESMERRAQLNAAMDRHRDPRQRVLALFDLGLELARVPGFRGCAFVNVAVEVAEQGAPLHRAARAHKEAMRGLLEQELETAGVKAPSDLSLTLLLLWDGALVETYLRGEARPLRLARKAASELLDSALSTG
jgi:AcrR family transcriptional regulator